MRLRRVRSADRLDGQLVCGHAQLHVPGTATGVYISKLFYLFFFTGQDLLDDHRFTVDCVQPKCTELRRLVQKLEVMLGEKRRILHKFLDLIDGIEAANKWSTSALSHLSRQEDPRSSLTDEDVSTLQRPENLRS